MRTLFISFLGIASILARPTLDETLDLQPVNPPLGVTFFPTPPLPAGVTLDLSDYGLAMAVRGEFAFIGVPINADNGAANPGSVFVYRRSGSTWEQVQQLAPPDVEGRMRFGRSLAVSDDGAILVVGSNDIRQTSPTTRVSGGAYLYNRNGRTGRYELAQKLVPASTLVTEGAGYAVGISGDWIVMGAPFVDDEGTHAGAAFLFQRDSASGVWVERQSLLPDSLVAGDRFGSTVAIDGLNVCVAAPRIDLPGTGTTGEVFLYRLDPATGIWLYETKFATPEKRNDFGEEMGLSGDRLLVSYGDTEAEEGHTYYYRRVDGSWVAEPKLTSNPGGDHQTDSSYGGRAVVQSGPVAVTSGVGLGELFRFKEGAYSSDLVLGAVLAQATPPPAYDSFRINERAQKLATDGTTVMMLMRAEKPGGIPEWIVAAISPESSEVAAEVPPLLFYHAASSGLENEAAFAYQVRLYSGDEPGNYLTSHDQIDTYFAQVNRDNAALAEDMIRLGYPGADAATGDQLEGYLLDLAYGRAAAQLIISKNKLRRLNQQRLVGVTVNGTGSPHFFLDDEIVIVREALEEAAAGIDEYLRLVQDPLGVAPVEGNPAGRALFTEHVPGRALAPATDSAGNPVNGSAEPLLTGYKDLVLLYDLFLHYTRIASDLALILTASNTPEESEEALALIGDTQRIIFEQRHTFDALVPGLTPAERDSLGITRIANGIDSALSDLTAFEQNLEGTINLLGYEPDFLMLIDDNGTGLSSYDNFKALLDHTFDCVGGTPTGSAGTSRLGIAVKNRCAALDAFDDYERNQQSLGIEFGQVKSTIIPRLTEIVGVRYGEVGYDDPLGNEGSEIWQQSESIKAARLRIRRNGAEIANLHEKVRIEERRRAAEAGINAELSAQIIDWGEERASLTEEIGRIEAAQAAADAMTELFEIENITKAITGVGVLNAAVQAGGEVWKANLEADKDRLAATQDAAIRDADDNILANNSNALVQTILLEMNTLLIDSEEAALLLRQEAGRLTSLLCEKADLERRFEEADATLAARYFADPVHRLRALDTTLLAEITFEDARKWIFFITRAAEYKWNTPFTKTDAAAPDGFGWTIDDLFKLRNADELQRYYVALVQWEQDWRNLNEPLDPTPRDWFSLREDYFGYKHETDDQNPVQLSYDVVNPDTGLLENVDAITAFRYELKKRVANVDEDPQLEVPIEFDTVRFNGWNTSTGVYQGKIFSPENYLDRIETLKIFIKGPHESLAYFDAPANTQPVDGENVVPVTLTYGGTSIIRRQFGSSSPGQSFVPSEITSYPARFFFSSSRNLGGYEFTESLAVSTQALKIMSNRFRSTIEDLAWPPPVTPFKERSVATTSWVLTLQLDPTGGQANSRLSIDEIDDVELFIIHEATKRPSN